MITGKPRRAISKWPRIYSFFFISSPSCTFPYFVSTPFIHFIFTTWFSSQFYPPCPPKVPLPPPSPLFVSVYRCRMFPQISTHSLAVISFLSHVFFFLAPRPRQLFSPNSNLFFLFHLIRPLFRLPPPVSRILKHQHSQRAVKPPADSTHNSPLLIMRTLGAHGAEFKRWKQQLEEVYESVLVRRWKWEFGAWCWRQLSVFLWCKNLFESFSW